MMADNGQAQVAAPAKARRKKAFTPFADARRAILAFGERHPHLTAAAAAPACAAMVLLLVWFLVFSGYDAPQQFIYAGF